jgi:hypothetical protein
MLDLAQLEHGLSPVSDCASHLIFLRRHSSHARETLDRFLGGMLSFMAKCGCMGATATGSPCIIIASEVGVSWI